MMTGRSSRAGSAGGAGFTIIELLIVVAIIGILAMLIIPNMLESLQKARQSRTVADARDTGTGMMTWLADQWGAAAAGASSTEVDFGAYPAPSFAVLEDAPVPAYIQVLPPVDGWRSGFDYRLDLVPDSDQVMGIRSGGRDGVYSGDTYVAGAFDPTDYDQDIVWTDGFFVRWPQKLTN